MQSHNDSFYSYFPVSLVRLSRLRQKNGLKGKFNHWPKTQMKVTKNFSFQFRMSDSGGNDFWVAHFSRIQASLSKMFNLENDRRKVIQRRRAAKKSWELSLGSMIVCSTGCLMTDSCECVDDLTLCWIVKIFGRILHFQSKVEGWHPILVISLIGVEHTKLKSTRPHPELQSPTLSRPESDTRNKTLSANFFRPVVYENIHNLSPSDRG